MACPTDERRIVHRWLDTVGRELGELSWVDLGSFADLLTVAGIPVAWVFDRFDVWGRAMGDIGDVVGAIM